MYCRASALIMAAVFCFACQDEQATQTVYSNQHAFEPDLQGLQAIWARQVEQQLAAGIQLDAANLPVTVDLVTAKDSNQGLYHVELRLPKQTISSANPLNYELRIKPMQPSTDDLQIEVAGGMPLHSHGLPTNPIVETTTSGRYHLRGVVFSMAGWWQLVFGIATLDGQRFDIVTFDVFVPP